MSVAIVAVVCIFQFGGGDWPPLRESLRTVPLGLLVTLAITGLAFSVMPRVAHLVGDRNAVIRWAILVAAMIICGAAGLAVGVAVFAAIGFLPAALIVTVFRQNIIGVSTTTIVVGTGFTIFGFTKARLEATELALQTQRLEREHAEKLAAEAKLASLSSRVQPHFLFNALNSISALVRHDPAEAERTVERLASLLRSSLDRKEQVSLDQELKLVADYLEIQRTRLGQRLRFNVSVARRRGYATALFHSDSG